MTHHLDIFMSGKNLGLNRLSHQNFKHNWEYEMHSKMFSALDFSSGLFITDLMRCISEEYYVFLFWDQKFQDTAGHLALRKVF